MADINMGKRLKRAKLPDTIKFQPILHKKQREMWADTHRFQVLTCGRRFGKALAINTPILKSDNNWTIINDLKIGDKIYGDDGKETTIISITGTYENRPCYKLIFDNGSTIIADEFHDWIMDIGEGKKKYTTKEIFIKFQLGYSVKLPEYIIPIKSAYRSKQIIDIFPIPSVPVKCITVNNKSHLFLAGSGLIPTHNSTYAAYKIIKEALSKNDSLCWVVSPKYSQSMSIFKKIIKYCPQEVIVDLNRSDKELHLINGSSICAKSGDNIDTLRGDGLDFVILEEAGYLKDGTWDEVIRPALGDKLGKAIMIGTPFGKNEFYNWFLLGEDPAEDEWISFKCSTYDNPMITRTEIAKMKRSMPPRTFAQEILAEFLDDAGAVFNNIKGIIRPGMFIEPVWNHYYLMGVDLAKYQDYTVITVMDIEQKTVVYWERFNSLDWDIQKERIVNISKKYNRCTIAMDGTGVGDPIVEDLFKQGCAVRPFIFTNKSKRELITKLQFAIHNREFTMPNLKQVINELNAYSYTLTKSKNMIFAAPKNTYDDTVMSLGLVVYNMDLIVPPVTNWEYY